MPKVTLEAFDLIRDSDQLLRWLAQPHVAKWWGDAGRAMQHARECAPESQALIVADGTPVGYLCWQEPAKEELETANLADLPGRLVDIDIFIGDADLLGQGVGSGGLRLLLARLRRDPSIAFAGLGTAVSNTNAIRCYEKAGFRLNREFEDPEWGPCKYLIAEVHGAAEQGVEADEGR